MTSSRDGMSIFNPGHCTVYQDMNQPLSHYFIATSHNTYLTKDQLKSRSSLEAYISAFQRGCKCVEIDIWDGPDNEPIVYHGHTLTSKILFRDVILTVRDYAFCVNRYPVILSFENHCSVEQQLVMARHLKQILGNMLHTQPADNSCGESRLPSPAELMGYVLIKGKKLDHGMPDDFHDVDDDYSDEEDEHISAYINRKKTSVKSRDACETSSLSSTGSERSFSSSTSSTGSNGSSSLRNHSISELMSAIKPTEVFRMQKAEKAKVRKVAQELSDLVTWCQSVAFHSFEYSRNCGLPHHLSSFGEHKAVKLSSEDPVSFLTHNRRHLSRTFPAGFRIDSSNYNPVHFWAVGCQLVALNYQTACYEMQLNQGLFLDNGGCGYVLKPAFMRQERISFNPFASFVPEYEMTIKDIRGYRIACSLSRRHVFRTELKVLLQVRTAGIPSDTITMRTEPVKYGGESQAWSDQLKIKISVPQLTLVQFGIVKQTIIHEAIDGPYSEKRRQVQHAVIEGLSKIRNTLVKDPGNTSLKSEHSEHGMKVTHEKLIGQYTLPFSSIQPGRRRIFMQDKHSQPLEGTYVEANVSIQQITKL